ncbi:MAG: AMP-binding protein [Deltaproteobacteria bacterium]|nr:AMP-binding protein [Deltaproteobacteria bacterium]
MTLIEMLERNAREFPDKTAVIFHGLKMSWAGLDSTVNRLANGLIEKGLRKGDRVGIMLPRTPEIIISFLAAAKARAIAVPINFELTEDNIRATLEVITPRFLIVNDVFLGHAAGSLPEGANIGIIAAGERTGDYINIQDIIGQGSPERPGQPVEDEDVVYLNYTSGTTGSSKGAITTHSNIYWNTIASVEALGLTHCDIHICMFAPFAHPHEIFARPLYLGGTMVLVDTVYPKSIAEAVSLNRVTCMMGLSPMYENLLELAEHRVCDLTSLRIIESGGMYTRTDLIDRFKAVLGARIIPVWGSTETTGIAIANRPNEKMPEGSIGRECLSYSVKVVDDSGEEVMPGEIGEFVFNGPAVVRGYYEDGADNSAFRDRWYYSGDLGRKDERGYFYFVERKTGMMKVAGLKVYPMEIERILLDHPYIKEATVISAKDRLRGEVPKAIITTMKGKALTVKDVLRFCRQRLPNYKTPRIVEFRESIPKTSSGKINKKVLQLECAECA